MRLFSLLLIGLLSITFSQARGWHHERHHGRHHGHYWRHHGPIVIVPGVPVVRPYCKRHPFDPKCGTTSPTPRVVVPIVPPTMTVPPSTLVVPGLPHVMPPSTIMPSVPGGTSVPPTPIFR